MKPGLYKLKQDVRNHEGDKRVRRDWYAQSVWKEDRRFIVMDHYAEIEKPFITPLGRFCPMLLSKFPELCAALVPCEPETAETALNVDGVGAEWLEDSLKILIRENILSYDLIIVAARVARNEEMLLHKDSKSKERAKALAESAMLRGRLHEKVVK